MSRGMKVSLVLACFLGFIQQTLFGGPVCQVEDCGENALCVENMCECDKGFYNFFSPYIATIDGCFATCDITGDNSECNRNQLCEVKNFFPECVCKEGFTGEQCDERITTTTMATTSAMTTTIRERGLPRLALTAALGIPAFIVVTAGLLGSSYYG